MSWPRVYRVALRALPAGLRRKHGDAMQALFCRELERARVRGALACALVGVAALWDVARRGVYERLRPVLGLTGDSLTMHQPSSAGEDVSAAMPRAVIAQLPRRLAVAFATACTAMTVVLVAHFAARQLPALLARGAPAPEVLELLLLAVPFTLAMTIPMAVLVAVLRVMARLRAEGALAATRGIRGAGPLVGTVLRGALAVTALALVVTAELVPRANARLATVLAGRPMLPSDRTMTIGQLREAARSVRASDVRASDVRASDVRASNVRAVAARAIMYEVEVQKKLALPAACLVLALVGLAVGLRAASGGMLLVVCASVAVIGAYYMLLVAGEGLADQALVSPVVAMWGANALLAAAALVALRPSGPPLASRGGGAVAAGG